MLLNANGKIMPYPTTKMLLIMKMVCIFLFAACLQAQARLSAQTVTYSIRNAGIEKVFREIKKQTGYAFVYSNRNVAEAKPVTINVKNAALEEVLRECFKDQPFTYEIVNKTIIIKEKKPVGTLNPGINPGDMSPPQANIDVTITVLNTDNQPLEGASIIIKGSNKGIATDINGRASLRGVDANATIIISFTGYASQEYKLASNPGLKSGVNNPTPIVIRLVASANELNEVIVNKGYYTEKQKLSTGNTFTLRAKEIEKQPVTNPLLALQGRVPGLRVTQAVGMPGGLVGASIRGGNNSLTQGNIPFYVIDGVPYIQQLLPNFGDVIYGGSPLSFINPLDIESIDVLKDADATAIYGSRAANGVILITTKTGKVGQTKINVNIQNGWGKVASKLDVLNTPEYLQMRREAISNDGGIPRSSDYDFTLWDTTRNTDWQNELIGKTAKFQDLQVSVLGGNANIQYLIGAGYNKQTTVFPGDFSDRKGSVHFNIRSFSNNKKFMISMTGSYQSDDNRLPGMDLTNTAITLAPDAPPLYSEDGTLNWAPASSGYPSWPGFINPVAYLNKKYNNLTNNLVANAIVAYQLLPGLEIKSSFGYTYFQSNDISFSPMTVIPPAFQTLVGNNARSASYSDNNNRSWIAEPQVSYTKNLGNGILSALAGMTFQQQKSNGKQFKAQGFSSDNLIENILAASNVSISGVTNSEYKYNALFGRLNYNRQDKYLANITFRRDGSSRFGPENRFHNFMAAGVAWIFSKERFIQNHLSFLSYGKMRGSYGTTGNDQVGNYSFLDLYGVTQAGVPYQGIVGLQINRLNNPVLAWEETKKTEAALELGFLRDRILFSVSYYENNSSNQLTSYKLPSTAGFPTIQQNLDARIQNKGWELTLNTTNIQQQNFKWKSSVNLSRNRNKLTRVDPSMQYYQNFLGRSLGAVPLYHFLGVNPANGVYHFADVQGNSTSNPNPSTDQTVWIDMQPKFYGGFQNSFTYKGVALEFLFQFERAVIKNYRFGNYPGAFNDGKGNQPKYVLDRWQKPGDNASIQRYNTNYSIYNPYNNAVNNSDAGYSDGSFIRLKNIALSWQLPKSWSSKARLQNVEIYAHAQNLITITNYKGLDPETARFSTLPPLRVVTVGIRITSL